MKRFELQLHPGQRRRKGGGEEDGSHAWEREDRSQPVMGWFAVIFGVLGILTLSFVFVPLAFACAVVAILMGQVTWGLAGFVLAILGVLTSPLLLGLIGLGAAAVVIDWSSLWEMIQHGMDQNPAPPDTPEV